MYTRKLMGSEISHKEFNEDDFKAFQKAYDGEISYIKTLFAQGSSIFSDENKSFCNFDLSKLIFSIA